MDEYKVLIYHLPSNGDSWYDATDSVVWYGDKGNCWNVKFRDMDKFYLISYSKMKIFTNPKEIQFAELYYKGSPCFGVSKLICFDDCIYKIFYLNGYKRIANTKELKIVKNTLKEHGGDGTTYSPEQKRLMVWYTYFFLNRGKPSTHFSVLSSIEPITLKERMPEVFDRLIIQAEQKIKDGFGEDNNA